jgi:hypothetical protein
MASGWAPDGAVHDQIDDSITDAVRLARARLPIGPGEIFCQICGDAIPRLGAKRCPQLELGLIASPATIVAPSLAV